MTSIGRRLGISLFVSLLLAGLLISQGALWWLEREQRDSLSASLRDDAAGVLTAIGRDRNDVLTLDPTRLHPAYRRPLSGRYFVVLVDDSRWRSRSLWDATLSMPESPGMDPMLQPGPGGQQLLRYRGEYRMNDQPVTIVVAQDYTPVMTAYARTRTAVLIAWLVVLLVLAGVQQWLLRRGLSPLRQARKEIEQLRGGQRNTLNENVALELHPLVVEINRLQRHTEQQLQRSRHGLGDLGHALKTPLAVLKNRCNEQLKTADPALHALLQEQLDQMEATIRRALGRARVAAGVTASNRFCPADHVPLLVTTLERAHHRSLQVTVEGDQLTALPLERDDMLEVLGNLLDNAFKWAKSHIRLTLDQGDGQLCLCVEDDGPGIAPERRQQVLQRGQRLDERTPGDGLGLAIVSDTVGLWRRSVPGGKPAGGLAGSGAATASAWWAPAIVITGREPGQGERTRTINP